MDEWRYYNHAIIPNIPPHLQPSLETVKDGSIWHNVSWGGMAVFAQWIEDWDSEQETAWYYCIIDRPLDLSKMKAKRRYEHKKASKHFFVKQIDPLENLEKLRHISREAYIDYPLKYRPPVQSIEEMHHFYSLNNNLRVYGAFFRENGEMVGFSAVRDFNDYADFCLQKVIPRYEKYAANLALIDFMLKEYEEKLKDDFYISDGAKSINHETHFQEYLIKYAGFRKCYCTLHIAYRKPYDLVMRCLYVLRRLLWLFDDNTFFHKVNVMLKIHDIANKYSGE